jgi:asparagine synthetase B (glutamine-hydrolysing)
MSGIAGIVHLDGSPIDACTLQRMTDAIAHRGPDGAGTWADGPAGLGHRMLRTTPEALQERQPLCDESGQVCLVLDGRVDNREDPAKAPGAPDGKDRIEASIQIPHAANAARGATAIVGRICCFSKTP